MISESLYFIYDGVNFYEKYNIINVHIDSGMYEESFISNRIIKETRIRGGKTYFQEIEDENLSFSVSFAFEDSFDRDKIRAVARDLKKSFYCPLIFSQDPEKIYFALCTDESKLIHTGLGTGYINLNFRCNSAFSFSPIYSSPIYDLSTNSIDGTNIELINNGDVEMYSIIEAQVINGGSFSIVNMSNGGEKISFSGISNEEIIIINTEIEDISTSAPLTYRYDNMSSDSVFILFQRGINNLKIYGNIKLQFKYENRFLI